MRGRHDESFSRPRLRTLLLILVLVGLMCSALLWFQSGHKAEFSRSSQFAASINRVSIGVISSKNSFHRVEHYCRKWRPSGAHLTVWVEEMPPVISDEFDEITHVSSAMRSAWWNKTKKDYHTRLAWTIWDLIELQQDVDWYMVIDDDALVFPEGLLAMLHKYDPNELWYLGNISEDAQQVQIHGRMAYGGGGYVLSRSAAKLLHDTLAACLPRYDAVYGQDSRIFSCLSELDIHLTVEPGFHQFDLEGDIRGMLEQHPPRPLITLHHLDKLDPVYPHLSTDAGLDLLVRGGRECGSQFMQQSVVVNRLNQWTFSIAEGFSIKWFERAKLTTWVRSAEITFNRFMKKKHRGIGDWTFDTRRRYPRCRQYDAFYWNGTTSDNRHIYVHSQEPFCLIYSGVNVIYVTVLPGTFANPRACTSNAADAELTEDLRMTLCGTRASHLLEFSLGPGKDSPEAKRTLRTALLNSRFGQTAS